MTMLWVEILYYTRENNYENNYVTAKLFMSVQSNI